MGQVGAYAQDGAGLIACVPRHYAATAFSIGSFGRNAKTIATVMDSTAVDPATRWESVLAFVSLNRRFPLTGIQILRVPIGLLAR